MKLCCSQGKARITYLVPSKKIYKYSFDNQKWNFLEADEPLLFDCVPSGRFKYRLLCTIGETFSFETYDETDSPLSFVTYDEDKLYETRVYFVNGISVSFIILNGSSSVSSSSIFVSDAQRDFFAGKVIPQKYFLEGAKYNLLVTGEETGMTYLDLKGASRCPNVQQAGCVFDPKNEQTLTVELGFFDAPILRNIPGFPNALPTTLRDCVEVVTQDNAIQIRKVGEIGYYVGENLVWIPTGLFSVVKQVDSPQGCPPPKVKIECEGDPTDRSKKCPPETDCHLECNGFLCCYSKGKLIQSIKL